MWRNHALRSAPVMATCVPLMTQGPAMRTHLLLMHCHLQRQHQGHWDLPQQAQRLQRAHMRWSSHNHSAASSQSGRRGSFHRSARHSACTRPTCASPQQGLRDEELPAPLAQDSLRCLSGEWACKTAPLQLSKESVKAGKQFGYRRGDVRVHIDLIVSTVALCFDLE